MSYQITDDMRQALLDRAVEAMREMLACGPDTDSSVRSRLGDRAKMAVTDAVTRGDHLHTLIAQLAGCSGLQVINMIAEWSAQGKALGVERNAAKNYGDLVRDAARQHALQRVGTEGHGAKARIVREIGVTRSAVDEWIAQAAAERERPYS